MNTEQQFTRDSVNAFAKGEMGRIADETEANIVKPWIRDCQDSAISARVLSASPSRSGLKVQVRVRISPGKIVSATFPRWVMYDQDPKTKVRVLKKDQNIMILVQSHVLDSIFRVGDFETRLRSNVHGLLMSLIVKKFPQSVRRSLTQSGASEVAGGLVRDWASTLYLDSRIMSLAPVPAAVDALTEKAKEAIQSVPDSAYAFRVLKAEADSARRQLLKAMSRAMKAGLSDEDVEAVRMAALAGHVMGS